MPPELRAACREVWGVRLVDVYSSTETGYMALQCPDHDLYHVQSEDVLVEVLDDEDKPCAPGQVGRVVVLGVGGTLAAIVLGPWAAVICVPWV